MPARKEKRPGRPGRLCGEQAGWSDHFVISTSSTLVVLVEDLVGLVAVGVSVVLVEFEAALARKISTRRFWGVLPLGVLGTAGLNSPQPAASMRSEGTPILPSSSITAMARWAERWRLVGCMRAVPLLI